MKLQWLSLSVVLLVSSVGCCHTQCVSSSACDPCYRASSCCLTDWFRSKFSCRTCQNYSWSDGGCCDSMGGGCASGTCGMSMDAGMTYGGAPGGSSCGCGRTHYAPATTTPATAIPVPQADPVPTPVPGTTEPTPAPPATPDTTQFQRPTTNQVQHVSVEEFHRLPGVVVSGPSPAPAATPTLAPPQLSNVAVPVPARQTVQQAQWVPAR